MEKSLSVRDTVEKSQTNATCVTVPPIRHQAGDLRRYLKHTQFRVSSPFAVLLTRLVLQRIFREQKFQTRGKNGEYEEVDEINVEGMLLFLGWWEHFYPQEVYF